MDSETRAIQDVEAQLKQTGKATCPYCYSGLAVDPLKPEQVRCWRCWRLYRLDRR